MWYVNSVQGAPWTNTPIVWTGASGNWLAAYNYGQNMTSEAASFQRENNIRARAYQRSQQDTALSGTTETAKLGANLLDVASKDYNPLGSIISWAAKMGETALNAARNTQDYFDTKAYNDAVYSHNRTQEMVNYGYSQGVVEPEISNPYQSTLVRELSGNGVIVYRYKYRDSDVSRIDKLLTMYGYAITRPVTITDIFPTGKSSGFVYLECQGVQLTSDTLPMWYLDLMQDELTNGVRIWWERPNPGLYETEEN